MQKRPELGPESRKKTLAEKILDSEKLTSPSQIKKEASFMNTFLEKQLLTIYLSYE